MSLPEDTSYDVLRQRGEVHQPVIVIVRVVRSGLIGVVP